LDVEVKNRFQRRKERTRSQIKNAAISLILEKGYDAITIDAIVERADVGKGTFYLHFKDKESLVWDVIREGLEQVAQETNRRYQNQTNMEYFGFLVAFEHADQNRDLYRIMLGGRGNTLLTQRVKEFLVEETEREIRAHTAFTGRDLPPDFMAQYVIGALMQILVWWIETPNATSPAQMADKFYQMVFLKRYPVEGATD
jgi:AcrR family transcriptional regulator